MGDLDLAREAVALPGWRWMPGMLLTNGQRIDGAEQGRPVRRTERPDPWSPIGAPIRVEEYSMPPYLPDLDDAATRGCLLELVREAWPAATLCHVREDHAPPGRWVWCWRTIDDGGDYGCYRLGPAPFASRLYPTEAHALVAALRAAGGARG